MRKNILFLVIAFALILPASILQAFELGDVQIHGFYSQGYLKTDDNNYLAETEDGSLQFDEFAINFSAQLTDDLRAGLQLNGRDLGPVGNNDVRLDWAYMDYRWHDWLGVRIGKLRTIYGIHSESREIDMLRTVIMVPQSIYSELWRDSFSTIRGVSMYGMTPKIDYLGSFRYDLGVGVHDLDKETGFANVFEDALKNTQIYMDVDTMDHEYTNRAGLTWYTPLEGLRLQYTYYDIKGLKLEGDADIPAYGVSSRILYEVHEMDGSCFSLEYVLGNFTLTGEYQVNDFEGKMDLGLGMGFMDRDPVDGKGWYIMGDYRFNRYFTLAVTYSDYYPNRHDKDGDTLTNDFEAWLKTWTLSTRIDINQHWILKLEASYNDGFGAFDSMGNDPAELERYWMLYAAKVTCSF